MQASANELKQAESCSCSLTSDELALLFEERAAIAQYDGGLSQEAAEQLARTEVYGRV